MGKRAFGGRIIILFYIFDDIHLLAMGSDAGLMETISNYAIRIIFFTTTLILSSRFSPHSPLPVFGFLVAFQLFHCIRSRKIIL